MDIQFISESSGRLNKYIAGYITKSKKPRVTDVLESASHSAHSVMFGYGAQLLGSREVSIIHYCCLNNYLCSGIC
jgi:hypothetical protein